MAELVDAHDSKSCAFGRAGSIPALGTKLSVTESFFVLCRVPSAFSRHVESNYIKSLSLTAIYPHMSYYKLTLLLLFYSVCLLSCDDSSDNEQPKPDPVIETFAGGEAGFVDGMGTAARFNEPMDIAFSPSGEIYVVDQQETALRKISTSGNVTTIFSEYPQKIKALAVGKDGTVFLAGSTWIGKLQGDGSIQILVNGLELPSEYHIGSLMTMAVIPDGSLLIFEGGNTRIINFSATGEFIAVLCNHPQMFNGGDRNGKLSDIYFTLVYDIFVADNGEMLFTDQFQQDVRKISLDKTVTTVLGAGYDAPFRFPIAVEQHKDGRIFVAEARGLAVIETSKAVTYIANLLIPQPMDLLLSKDNKTLYVTNGNKITKVTSF